MLLEVMYRFCAVVSTKPPDDDEEIADETEDDGDETETEDEISGEYEQGESDVVPRSSLKAARLGERRAKKTARQLQQKLDEQEKKARQEKQTETERLRDEVTAAQKLADESQEKLKKLARQNQIIMAAGRADFTDPEDVVAFLEINPPDLNDEGLIDDIDEQLDLLKQQKPYLIKVQAGSVSEKDATLSVETPGNVLGSKDGKRRSVDLQASKNMSTKQKREDYESRFWEAKKKGDARTMNKIYEDARRLTPKSEREGKRRTGLFTYVDAFEEAP